MFEVDPNGTVKPEPSHDVGDHPKGGYFAQYQQKLLDKEWKRFKEQVKRASEEPGVQIGRRLIKKGGCLFAPLYLVAVVFSIYWAAHLAEWMAGNSGWWIVAWALAFTVIFSAIGYPLFWLDRKLFPEAQD